MRGTFYVRDGLWIAPRKVPWFRWRVVRFPESARHELTEDRHLCRCDCDFDAWIVPDPAFFDLAGSGPAGLFVGLWVTRLTLDHQTWEPIAKSRR